MAEALFDDAVDRSSRLRGEARSQSAGTFAAEGAEATEEAVEVMNEMELDIHRHRSQQFNSDLAEWADLILTMESRHIEELEAMAPEAEGKIHTLLGYINGVKGFADEKYDIIDPYKEPVEEYRKCAKELKAAVEKLVKQLEKTMKED
jgi:protein-tyrosine-phosphatase